MTRLNNSLRDTIARNAYNASLLPKQHEALNAKLKAAARDIMSKYLPEGFEDIVKSLPREWFMHATTAYIGYGTHTLSDGSTVRPSGVIGTSSISLDDPLPVPADWGHSYSSELAIWVAEYYVPQYTEWKEARRRFEDSIKGLLSSVRTVDKLLKIAPEFKQFVPQDLRPFFPPAIPVSNTLAIMASAGIVFQQEEAIA